MTFSAQGYKKSNAKDAANELVVIRKVGHTEVFNCTEIKATDLNNNKAERLQLCPINKTYKAKQQVSYRTPLACLPGRKPSDQFNTDTELPLCAYYLSRHKTTGARSWMSIPGILGLVYTPLNILKFSVLPQWSYTWQHTKTTSDLSYELYTTLYYPQMPQLNMPVSQTYLCFSGKTLLTNKISHTLQRPQLV